MRREIKILSIVFLLSLPLWWGVNVFQRNLEDFLFGEKIVAHPELVSAQLLREERLAKLKPLRNREIGDPELQAEAVISVFVDPQGVRRDEKILFEKNADRPLPIASLTKLMTAKISLKHYNIEQEETIGLLSPLLIRSDNQAAVDLAEIMGKEEFLILMNLEAKNLGMENTFFANPAGLDPIWPEDPINYSTARDLVKLARYITRERPLIWEISIIPEFEGSFNTNEFLGKISGIIGGKTGTTLLAGESFLLVVRAPKNKGFIVNVILNSENRFEEMRKLVEWTKYAYKW